MAKERPYPRNSWSVQGYSSNILDGPLFDVDDMSKLVVRDCDGKPVFALIRMHDRGFMQSDASQSDWQTFCRLHGVS
jgi:hypothetical protein